jgi:hypothetical protein
MSEWIWSTCGIILTNSGVPRWGGGVQTTPPPRNSEVLTKMSRNSLKVPKIKKILLYEIRFLVHSNAHKVIAGFFLSPDTEVT